METIIAAIITALGTLAVALLTSFLYIKPKLKELEIELGNYKELLSKEHESLSKENCELRKPLEYLHSAQLQSDARRERAQGEAQNIEKMIDTLHAMQGQMDRQQQQLREQSILIAELKQENQQLRDKKRDAALKDLIADARAQQRDMDEPEL